MQPSATPSIRRRLLQNMVLPVAVVAIVFGIGGAVLIYSVVSLMQDRLLDAALLSIVDRAAARAPAHLDETLAQGAIEILTGDAHDTFAFCVSDSAGFERGDSSLCALTTDPAVLGRITHAPADLNETKVRIAMTARAMDGFAHPLVFRLAETLNSRLNMEARMLVVLVFFEAVLISAAAILSYLAILRGLLPLTEISQELLGRASPGAVPFTRIDTARVPEEAVDLDQRVDLAGLAADVLAERAPDALKRHVDIALDAPDEAIEIAGNALLLKEIIANLVDNAIAHTPDGGCVTARVAADDMAGTIAIEDDGPGIPEEERARVFQRFYQIVRADAKPGSGLGLAIARRIADLHGGSITLGDPPTGRGLSARLTLSRLEPVDAS